MAAHHHHPPASAELEEVAAQAEESDSAVVGAHLRQVCQERAPWTRRRPPPLTRGSGRKSPERSDTRGRLTWAFPSATTPRSPKRKETERAWATYYEALSQEKHPEKTLQNTTRWDAHGTINYNLRRRLMSMWTCTTKCEFGWSRENQNGIQK